MTTHTTASRTGAHASDSMEDASTASQRACCGNPVTTAVTAVEPDAGTCCGTLAEAQQSGGCCGTAARAQAVAAGAGCCG